MKLAELNLPAQRPTAIEGIYVLDIPLSKVEELTNLDATDGDLAPLVWLFNNLIVAEDGTKFEDALTEEDIKANVGIMNAKAISEAAMEAMNAGGK